MAEVQMQCGPFTVVSLMSSQSATQLGLEPGTVAKAIVKATTVIIETPGGTSETHPRCSRGGTRRGGARRQLFGNKNRHRLDNDRKRIVVPH